MLILTRRIGERVFINDNIQITIMGVKGNQVRIGFESPQDVIIHREEIYNRIARGEPRPLKSWGREVPVYVKPKIKLNLQADGFISH